MTTGTTTWHPRPAGFAGRATLIGFARAAMDAGRHDVAAELLLAAATDELMLADGSMVSGRLTIGRVRELVRFARSALDLPVPAVPPRTTTTTQKGS